MKSALHHRLRTSKSFFGLLTFSLALTLSGMDSGHGFDGSDSEVPRIEQMSLVNPNSPKPNEPIAILLKTSDDKNWVKIDGPLAIGFSYRLLPVRNTPPNCSTVTTSFTKLEAVEIASQRITSSNSRKNQTFWLVGYLPAKKELVSNCTEYHAYPIRTDSCPSKSAAGRASRPATDRRPGQRAAAARWRCRP